MSTNNSPRGLLPYAVLQVISLIHSLVPSFLPSCNKCLWSACCEPCSSSYREEAACQQGAHVCACACDPRASPEHGHLEGEGLPPTSLGWLRGSALGLPRLLGHLSLSRQQGWAPCPCALQPGPSHLRVRPWALAAGLPGPSLPWSWVFSSSLKWD